MQTKIREKIRQTTLLRSAMAESGISQDKIAEALEAVRRMQTTHLPIRITRRLAKRIAVRLPHDGAKVVVIRKGNDIRVYSENGHRKLSETAKKNKVWTHTKASKARAKAAK